MTRIGINPARNKLASRPPSRVTVTMVTYLPHQSGYFSEKMSVILLALKSMIRNTGPDHDILVFDNGSCNEMRNELKKLLEAGDIRYLVLSDDNIGKIAALRMVFGMAPGEYVAYADDDVLFFPDWLPESMKIFDHFPQAGMVSGGPVRNASTYGLTAVDALIRESPEVFQVHEGRFIADEWEIDWCNSTGRDPETHLAEQANRKDMMLETGGVRAICGANHFQFIARKDHINEALPEEWSGKLMGQMVEMDENLDRLGFLRLSTTHRYTRHIGNALSESIRAEAANLDVVWYAPPAALVDRKQKHWLLRIRGTGRVLRWIYDRLFRIINEL